MAEFIWRLWLTRASEFVVELLRSVFISKNVYSGPTTMLHVVQRVRSVVFANSWSQNLWLGSSIHSGLLVP